MQMDSHPIPLKLPPTIWVLHALLSYIDILACLCLCLQDFLKELWVCGESSDRPQILPNNPAHHRVTSPEERTGINLALAYRDHACIIMFK